eukprot:PhM_4_TR4142/c0_g1_i1/m.22041
MATPPLALHRNPDMEMNYVSSMMTPPPLASKRQSGGADDDNYAVPITLTPSSFLSPDTHTTKANGDGQRVHIVKWKCARRLSSSEREDEDEDEEKLQIMRNTDDGAVADDLFYRCHCRHVSDLLAHISSVMLAAPQEQHPHHQPSLTYELRYYDSDGDAIAIHSQTDFELFLDDDTIRSRIVHVKCWQKHSVATLPLVYTPALISEIRSVQRSVRIPLTEDFLTYLDNCIAHQRERIRSHHMGLSTRAHVVRLPSEILSHALQFLPCRDHRSSLMLVCRQWLYLMLRDRTLCQIRSHTGVYIVGGVNTTAMTTTTIGSKTDSGNTACPCMNLRHPLRFDGQSWHRVDGEDSAMMTSGRYHCGVAVWNRKVYVFGGRNTLERLDSVEIFDVLEQTWSQGPPMPAVRSAPGCVPIRGKIYVIGGYDGTSEHSSVFRYDVESGMWDPDDTIAPMPHRACEITASTDGTYIYVVGGTQMRNFSEQRVLQTVQRYDTRSNEWKVVCPLKQRRMCPGVVVLPSSRVMFVIGGSDGHTSLDTTEICHLDGLDQINNQHNAVTPSVAPQLNLQRANASACVWDGRVYVAGGFCHSNGGPLATMEQLDSVAKGWNVMPSMPERRDACKAVGIE